MFEQLQEQKDKAQQEHDEKYDIKKMFRGIDNDEAAFLEFASKQQAEIDSRRFAVTAEVKEFRNEVAKLQTVISPPSTSATEEKKKPNVVLGKKKSQLELLAGCIKTKRKRSDADSSEDDKSEDKSSNSRDKNPTVSSQVENEDLDKQRGLEDNKEKSLENQESGSPNKPAVFDSSFTSNTSLVRQIGYIPSLGVYSDSSDSESSSSDSDILPSLFSNFTSTAK